MQRIARPLQMRPGPAARDPNSLLLELSGRTQRGLGEVGALSQGPPEVGSPQAGELTGPVISRREVRRHAMDFARHPVLLQDLPERAAPPQQVHPRTRQRHAPGAPGERMLRGRGSRDRGHQPIGLRIAMDEIIDPMSSGVLPGDERRPCHRALRGDGAGELSKAPHPLQADQVWQLPLGHHAAHEDRIEAVDAQQEEPVVSPGEDARPGPARGEGAGVHERQQPERPQLLQRAPLAGIGGPVFGPPIQSSLARLVRLHRPCSLTRPPHSIGRPDISSGFSTPNSERTPAVTSSRAGASALRGLFASAIPGTRERSMQ